MPRFIPRTIRWQLILGTTLLQCLLVAAVFWYVYHQQRTTLRHRTAERLTYQVRLLTSTSALELKNQQLGDVQTVLDDMLDAPTIAAARITDMSGRTLAYSSRTGTANYPPVSAVERRQLHRFYGVRIFDNGTKGMAAVANINVEGVPVALAWIYPDTSEDEVDLSSLLRSALFFALMAASIFSAASGCRLSMS